MMPIEKFTTTHKNREEYSSKWNHIQKSAYSEVDYIMYDSNFTVVSRW